MNTEPVLTTEQQSDIAFDILACSGIDLYTSVVSNAAIETGLVRKLSSDESQTFAATLEIRVYELLSVVVRGKKRSVHEAELATIVAALILANASAGDAIYSLLNALNKSNLRWVAAMSHELVLNRINSHSATETFSFNSHRDEDFDPCPFEAANDTHRCAA